MIKINLQKLLSLLIISTLSLGPCLAQETKVTRKRIEVKQAGEETKKPREYSNVIAGTIDPLRIFSGEFPVSVQYAPTDWFAVEAGTGLTWENYASNVIIDNFSFEERATFQQESYNINPSYLIELKLFPDGYVYDDTYFLSLRYQFRKYSKEVQFQNSSSGNYSLDTYRVYKDLAFLYGYQVSTGLDRLFLEYYAGFSLRFLEEKLIEEDFDNPGNATTYINTLNEQNTLGVLMGLKIGFLF